MEWEVVWLVALEKWLTLILEGVMGVSIGTGTARAVEMRRKMAEGIMLSASIVAEVRMT